MGAASARGADMATLAAGDGVLAPADTVSAAPAADRIIALDFVRGVALFGILLMNITGFGLPHAYSDPTIAGGATGADLWSWIVIQIGFEGTQRALFSMLFGAGVILLTSRLEAAGRADAADIYYRRNLWLIGFGMINAFLFLWFGDILYTYGVVALFLYPFRKLAPKALLAIGLGTLLLGALWNLKDTSELLNKHAAWERAVAARQAGPLTPAQTKAIAAWEEALASRKPPPAKIAEDVAARTGGYPRAFMAIAAMNSYFQTWYLYRYFFDIFGMMLIGMALYRLGVLTLERPTRLYVAMAVGGYAVGLTTNLIEVRWILAHGFNTLAFAQAEVSYDLGRLGMALGHLGALLLFVRSGALPWLRNALAAVGQMALTNYLTHSVVCSFLFIGLGWYNQLQRHELYYVVFAIWAVQLIVSPIWLRHFRFGPVEWLWRYLTYLRRPAFRNDPALAGAGGGM